MTIMSERIGEYMNRNSDRDVTGGKIKKPGLFDLCSFSSPAFYLKKLFRQSVVDNPFTY